MVGPLAERAAFDEVYAVLARDARQVPERACPWLPGLYLNSGHGSRGLISAPLSGTAGYVKDETPPVAEPLPARPVAAKPVRVEGEDIGEKLPNKMPEFVPRCV